MKKLLIIIMCCGALCVGNVSAMGDIYKLDATDAANMRLLDWSLGDHASLTYVGYKPGGPGDWIFGEYSEYGAGVDNMTYDVGFSGNMNDSDQSGLASLIIGLTNPGLSGTFDSFVLPIANDDDDVWNYQAYVTTSDGTIYSAWTVGVLPGSNQSLFVSTLGLNYEDITGIGFVMEYDRSLNEGAAGDNYAVSIVPVPGAILLGMLGLSIVGVKLRKFA